MSMPMKPSQPTRSLASVHQAREPLQQSNETYDPAGGRRMTFGKSISNPVENNVAIESNVPTASTVNALPAKQAKVAKPVINKTPLRERPKKSEGLTRAEGLRRVTEVVRDPNGDRRFITDMNQRMLEAMNELDYPTLKHLVLDSGSDSEVYISRRLKIFEDPETFNWVKQNKDPVGLTGYSLTDAGHDQIMAELPLTTAVPHDRNHAHRENLNTLFIKLKLGVEEDILFPIPSTSNLVNTPVPVLTKRWINTTGERSLRFGNVHERIAKSKERLLNDSSHPAERMSEFDITKGALKGETEQLLKMYKTQNSAFIFNVFGNDEEGEMVTFPSYGVHGVVLRPLVYENRAHGGKGDLSFNHDGLRLEIRSRDDQSYYEAVVFDNFHSGLYGRLHVFSDNSFIREQFEEATKTLEQHRQVPRGTGENWLIIHDQLPASVNHNGMGNQEFLADGSRSKRAVTKVDG